MSWIPNIAAYNYIKSIGISKNELKQIKRNINSGYQRIISRSLFQDDGSFSIWGDTGESNIWLTAYMVKLLSKAKTVISVNDKYIKNSLNFLTEHQKPDGQFESISHISHYSSDDATSSIPLTAFVISAFLESGYFNMSTKYTEVVEKGIKFIKRSLSDIKEIQIFPEAISAYVLALYNEQLKSIENEKFFHIILDDLLNFAQDNEQEIFWFNKKRGRSIESEDFTSIHIEIASYAMMALQRTDKKSNPIYSQKALKVMKWMMTKKNSKGGFYSTYDTGEFGNECFPFS